MIAGMTLMVEILLQRFVEEVDIDFETAVCAAGQLCLLAKVVPAGCKVNAPKVTKFVSVNCVRA